MSEKAEIEKRVSVALKQSGYRNTKVRALKYDKHEGKTFYRLYAVDKAFQKVGFAQRIKLFQKILPQAVAPSVGERISQFIILTPAEAKESGVDPDFLEADVS